jgi:hypothetical protein
VTKQPFVGVTLVQSFLVSSALVLSGCGGGDALDTETLDQVQEAIQFGVPATEFAFSRAVSVAGCTGTVIAPNFILTALHCEAHAGDTVAFYDSQPFLDSASPTRQVKGDPIHRSGTSVIFPGYYDTRDASDNFCDLALLELDSPIPSSSRVATLAWHYPSGGDEWGTKVGRGAHFEIENVNDALLTVQDQVESDDDTDGEFHTEHQQGNHGDSGGPFFDDRRVLGALAQAVWGTFDSWDVYTSVPFHLNFILRKIGYEWPGNTPQSKCRTGTIIDVLRDSSELRCQYACDHTQDCVAYNQFRFTPICYLLSNVNASADSDSCSSARK